MTGLLDAIKIIFHVGYVNPKHINVSDPNSPILATKYLDKFIDRNVLLAAIVAWIVYDHGKGRMPAFSGQGTVLNDRPELYKFLLFMSGGSGYLSPKYEGLLPAVGEADVRNKLNEITKYVGAGIGLDLNKDKRMLFCADMAVAILYRYDVLDYLNIKLD